MWLKILISLLTFTMLYWIFWDKLNIWILEIIKVRDYISCYTPWQVRGAVITVLTMIIIKLFKDFLTK